MAVINIENDAQYAKLASSASVSVVLFSAEWAEQCSQILNVMNELAKQSDYKELQFINIPAEDYSLISLSNQIEAVPTVIFVNKSTVVDRIDGVDVAALTTKCKKYAKVVSSTEIKSNESLDDRLKTLINKSKVMIFMKGDRHTPRCGFSKQLIAIINENGAEYETFDILTDEEVRQGLKTYSDWPTYPQVYVNGELIGGLDIIKELVANNELASTLSG